ncbi:unnamed protein product [Rotaria sp. Silwood2]|nr:unnamed protein product [Rotaria sp. Silwood2]CAF4245876.1 unnamed protein product [Rotaria sp. Silwood2]
MDFMLNTIEYSKSYKNFRNVDETRDVPESHYVCQWWVQQLQGIKIESNSNKSCRVKKKHRDQIRWNNAVLPFRRSVLTRMEIWVESYLEQWINRLSVLENETNRFEILLRFYEEYQSAVLNHCWSVKGPTDPIGYSRFILMSLTIIRVIHEKLCNDPRFERLALHSIDIPNLISLFEFLVLPTCEDMIRARDLYDHFYQLNHKLYPDLLKNIESTDSFGVYSAALSSTMNKSIQRIRAEAEWVKQQKIQEIKNAKEKYARLMKSISDLSCKCDNTTYGDRQICEKCSIQQQAIKHPSEHLRMSVTIQTRKCIGRYF